MVRLLILAWAAWLLQRMRWRDVRRELLTRRKWYD